MLFTYCTVIQCEGNNTIDYFPNKSDFFLKKSRMFHIVYTILDKIKEKEVSIAEIAKFTGIPEHRMYKWKGRDSKIVFEDALKLMQWADQSDKFPKTKLNLASLVPGPGASLRSLLVAQRELKTALADVEKRIDQIVGEDSSAVL